MLLPMVLVAGCSTGGQKITHSGFLPDYSRLQKPEKHKEAAVWVSPDYQPARYRQVIVAPVEWEAPRRDAKVEDMLRTELHDRLATAVSEHFTVIGASQSGLRTLRLRSAITGMRRTRWFLNAPLQAAQFATGGIGLFGPLQGGASEEIQIEDAQTGQPMIRIATFRNGKPWNMKGSYVAYDHARGAFSKAAELAARILVDPTEAAPKTARNPADQ